MAQAVCVGATDVVGVGAVVVEAVGERSEEREGAGGEGLPLLQALPLPVPPRALPLGEEVEESLPLARAAVPVMVALRDWVEVPGALAEGVREAAPDAAPLLVTVGREEGEGVRGGLRLPAALALAGRVGEGSVEAVMEGEALRLRVGLPVALAQEVVEALRVRRVGVGVRVGRGEREGEEETELLGEGAREAEALRVTAAGDGVGEGERGALGVPRRGEGEGRALREGEPLWVEEREGLVEGVGLRLAPREGVRRAEAEAGGEGLCVAVAQEVREVERVGRGEGEAVLGTEGLRLRRGLGVGVLVPEALREAGERELVGLRVGLRLNRAEKLNDGELVPDLEGLGLEDGVRVRAPETVGLALALELTEGTTAPTTAASRGAAASPAAPPPRPRPPAGSSAPKCRRDEAGTAAAGGGTPPGRPLGALGPCAAAGSSAAPPAAPSEEWNRGAENRGAPRALSAAPSPPSLPGSRTALARATAWAGL